jgi:hypothetical protein
MQDSEDNRDQKKSLTESFLIDADVGATSSGDLQRMGKKKKKKVKKNKNKDSTNINGSMSDLDGE